MKPTILEIRIAKGVSELPGRFEWARSAGASFHEIERALERARVDQRIGALYLELADIEIGWSQAESLHRGIRALRSQGKATVAFIEGAANATFLLACACETIVLAPSATLSLQALSSEGLFFKDLLGELGVSPELDAVGEFKSAGEMFEQRCSSEPHRREMKSILEDMNEQFIRHIAEGRDMTPDAAAAAIASGPHMAEDAKRAGLVDELGYEDSCDTLFEEALGKKAKRIEYTRYGSPGWLGRVARWRRPRVAVLHAVGVLTTGVGRSTASANTLREALQKLRRDRRVRAIVLRIESPGGGVIASDAIHRELSLTVKEKPVVVSMGNIAASGGYYIAAAASAVVAEGTSLTGSIGVIGGKFVVRRLLDRLGIHRETIALGGNAGIHSPLRSFTEEQRAWHRRYLEEFYSGRFLPVVAEGRDLTIEQADAAGRGRVWTGRQALGLGLVDELGGLNTAIRLAAQKAHLDLRKARIAFYPRRRSLLERLRVGLAGPREGLITELLERLALVDTLAREELLLLMPRIFRIR